MEYLRSRGTSTKVLLSNLYIVEGGIFGPNLVMRKEEIAGGRRCTLTQNAEVSNKNRVNDTLLSYFSSSTKYSKNCFFNLFVDTVLGTYELTLAKNRPLAYIFLQYNGFLMYMLLYQNLLQAVKTICGPNQTAAVYFPLAYSALYFLWFSNNMICILANYFCVVT